MRIGQSAFQAAFDQHHQLAHWHAQAQHLFATGDRAPLSMGREVGRADFTMRRQPVRLSQYVEGTAVVFAQDCRVLDSLIGARFHTIGYQEMPQGRALARGGRRQETHT